MNNKVSFLRVFSVEQFFSFLYHIFSVEIRHFYSLYVKLECIFIPTRYTISIMKRNERVREVLYERKLSFQSEISGSRL